MPTGAAKGFLDMKPATGQIVDQTTADPEVTFAAGTDVAADKLEAFWSIDAGFEKAAAAAAKLDPQQATAADVLAVLKQHGQGDLFPQFNPDEAAKIRDEGKIPVFRSWQDRVRSGSASWDGILTAAALASFAQDQDALDDRIRGQL
jgi:hypothetical protein